MAMQEAILSAVRIGLQAGEAELSGLKACMDNNVALFTLEGE